MKKGLCFALLLLFAACSGNDKTKTNRNDNDFDAWKEAFVLRLWEMNPNWASSVGYHKFDSVLVVPDATRRRAELAFAEKELKDLEQFDPGNLSSANRIDFQLIANHLKAAQWNQKELKSHEWDPSQYNVCGGFAEMLTNDYAPLDERLRHFSVRLKNVPAYYRAASENVKNPTSEHTQLAIDQNIGGLSVFDVDLLKSLKKSTLKREEKDTILVRSGRAIIAVKEFASFLEHLDNPNPRSFRLGKSLYAQKFTYDIQSNRAAKEIYEIALNHKKELHGKMVKLAHQLWDKYFGNEKKPTDEYVLVKKMIDKLSLNHAKPKEFQAAIERQIPELVKFVNDKKLLYLDPKKPLVVRKEPDYMAGVAGASISAPGPYDKEGNTYYNVGSLNGWPAERSESYLREYNDYVLQILNIHEAIPGHYTQLVYSNNSPSIIKSIFGNGAMVEGWAVYTELMMLENGYGHNAPEMWLMYYKWNLRTTCNTILDYSVHNLDMSRETAIHMLVNEAYQQQAEAEGKWKRATLSQVQLCSYFTGFTEICELRDVLKKKQGGAFDLKQFHEQFLSYGSAPVKSIRQLMLEKDEV